MSGQVGNSGLRVEQQLEELAATVAADRAQIDALQTRVEQGDTRADLNDERGQVQDERLADMDERLDDLEEHVDVDRAMIAELQAEGLLSTRLAAELKTALHSSRMIGAAIGIIMAGHKVDEEAAFELLRRASQRANIKLRILAEAVVRTGDVSGLLHA